MIDENRPRRPKSRRPSAHAAPFCRKTLRDRDLPLSSGTSAELDRNGVDLGLISRETICGLAKTGTLCRMWFFTTKSQTKAGCTDDSATPAEPLSDTNRRANLVAGLNPKEVVQAD